MATTFPAEVSISGSVEAGNTLISIKQVEPASPPVEPPGEGRPPVTPPVEPPVTPPVEPPVSPPSSSWEPPSYLRKDTLAVTVPKAPRPAYLVPFTDPVFKTKITRITGDPGSAIKNITGAKWGDQARHHYSCDQAWNSDQSLIFLDTNTGTGAAGGPVFLHGETYEPLFAPKGKPSGADVRWHHRDPALMNYAAGSKLGTWDPKTGEQKLIKDFGSAYSAMTFGPWKGSFSDDGDMVVLTCKKGGADHAFAYRISTQTKHPDVSAASVGGFGSARISPKGTYIVFDFSDTATVTDLAGKKIHVLANNSVSHFDVITDTAGDEVIVGRVNSSSIGQGPSGIISKYRMRDGKRTPLATGGWCSHTSARAIIPGRWVVADAQPQGGKYPPYDDELVMAALTGSAVYRLCHTHAATQRDYVAQTQASHSPDAGRVIFASTWDVSGSAPRPVGCYICDFRR